MSDVPTLFGVRDASVNRKAFLLTDVVGSTRLWDLHPESMSDALAAHDRVVQEAVTAHDGVLVKSKGEGDSTFSVFARASDAAAAALAAQDALGAHRWPAGATLRVRMAIHVGDAVERDGDYYGPTINRAARLRAIAGPEEVIVSQAAADRIVRSLDADVELVALGSRELRDLARPEQPYLLRRAGTQPAGPTGGEQRRPLAPLPEQLAMARLTFFVGRDPELDRLAPLEEQPSRASRAVLIGGEPGAGKTRLAAEAAARLHAAGWTVVFGRAEPDLGVPFAPLVDPLQSLIQICPSGILAGLPGRELAALELVAPQIAERVPVPTTPGADRETERDLLVRAVPRLVGGFATAAPLVIVLDDLHNAAPPALLLLRHTLRTPFNVPVLVIGTYRDTELSVRHPLAGFLADVQGVHSVSRLPLGGLSEQGVVTFLDAAGYQRDARSRALARAIHDESDGNPLFVAELLTHLAETGRAYQADGCWQTDAWGPSDLQLPTTAREVLQRRLELLSGNGKRLLEIASVIGREFPFWLVDRTASQGQGMTPDQILDAVEEAVDAGLVRDRGDGTYAFTHALLRQAVVAGLGTARRGRLHLLVAETLVATGDPTADEASRLARLAHHYFEAGVTVREEAVRYAVAAAEAASARLAFEDAATLYERALDALPDLPPNLERRVGLLLALGDSRWRAGEFKAAGMAFRSAADLAGGQGLSDLEARAALGFGGRGGHRLLVAGDGLVDLLRRVRSRIPPPSPGLLASVTARLAEALTLEAHGAGTEAPAVLARDAVALAREGSDDRTLAPVLLRSTYARWTPDNPTERLRDLDEVVARATGFDDEDQVVSARILREATLVELASTEEAREEWVRAAEGARRRGDAYSRWLVATVHASRLVSSAGPEQAEPAVWEALALGRRAQNPSALQLFGTQMFVLRREQGRLHELHAPSVAMVERHPDLGFARAVLALLYCEIGLDRRARRELDRIAGPAADFGPVSRDVLWLGTAALLAETCAYLGDKKRARALYEQLEPYSDRLVSLGLHGPHLGCLSHHVGQLAAVLGHDTEAHDCILAATAVNDRVAAPVAAARSRLALARLLVQRDDTSAARDLFTSVASDGERLGLTRLVSEARQLLGQPEAAVPAVNRPPRSSRVAQARSTLDYGRAILTSRSRVALGRLLGDVDDDDLQRRFGAPWAQRVLFESMTRGFQPTMAFGFEGDITFELLNEIGIESQPRASWWTISIRGSRASARRGASDASAASIRIAVPNLIRMVTGSRSSVAIVEEGGVDMDGDVLLIARLTEMFGGVTPLPTPTPPRSAPEPRDADAAGAPP